MNDLELAVTSMQFRGRCACMPVHFFSAHAYTLYSLDLRASFSRASEIRVGVSANYDFNSRGQYCVPVPPTLRVTCKRILWQFKQ